MTVRAYRTRPFGTTHENRQFDALLDDLVRVWGQTDEPVLLFGNFYCHGAEIDAAVLKRDSITVIDFKDYQGTVTFSENGPWTAGAVAVKAGSKPNPFVQIRDNRNALRGVLDGITRSWPSHRRPNLGHISGMVLFRGPISFDEQQVPRNLASWFHVVDEEHVIARLAQITSREINLAPADLDTIAGLLAVPEYTPVGTVKAPTPVNGPAASGALDLPDCLTVPMRRVAEFIQSDARILILTGMLGTGTEILLEALARHVRDGGRTCTVLAPNRRMAVRYPVSVEADSAYGHLYAGDPRFERDRVVFDLAENHDAEDHLYIVGDAHLISDSPFETDVLRYGSGRLLNDLFEFVGLSGSRRQIVFIGDPFQLTRGKWQESALCEEHVHALAGYTPATVLLDTLLPGTEADIFVANGIAIARRLEEQRFNQLSLETDARRCVRAPSEPSAWEVVAQEEFAPSPETVKYIAFSHAKVNEINRRVREDVLGLTGGLAPGDIVHIHNGCAATDAHDPDRTIFVPNDTFAEVMSVDDREKPLVQPLKGRDKPLVVPLLRVRARLLQDRQEISFLCLKDYLEAEKPEVDADTALALRVSAEARFREQRRRAPHSGAVLVTDDEDTDAGGPELARDRARFLRTDPYLNAARLRFGYALTLHRAQGQRFDTVIADLDTGQGQHSDGYFRWLYTMFTVADHRLVMFNAPDITLLARASWDDRSARVSPVKRGDLIPYDPDAQEDAAAPDLASAPERELRNLYRHIVAATAPLGIRVALPVQRPYREVYVFESNDGASCTLHLIYDGRFRVTGIETVPNSDPAFADRVRRVLTSGVRFTDSFQETLYNLLSEKLKSNAVSVEGVEHQRYQEAYYLKSAAGELRLQVHYDGDGFVTRVAPTAYTSPAIRDAVKDALGL